MIEISLRAKLFRKIRKELGLKQTDLAKELNVKPQYISNVENGRAPLSAKLAVDLLKKVKPKQNRLKKTGELMECFRLDYIADTEKKFIK